MNKFFWTIAIFIICQVAFGQNAQSKFGKIVLVNVNGDFGNHSMFGAGISIGLDDKSKIALLHGTSGRLPVFSTWLLTYKHNLSFSRIGNGVLNSDLIGLEFHNWNFIGESFLGKIPKCFKFNYSHIYLNGQTESLVSPEIGFSFLFLQMSYRKNYFLDRNSIFENVVGSNNFILNLSIPIYGWNERKSK